MTPLRLRVLSLGQGEDKHCVYWDVLNIVGSSLETPRDGALPVTVGSNLKTQSLWVSVSGELVFKFLTASSVKGLDLFFFAQWRIPLSYQENMFTELPCLLMPQASNGAENSTKGERKVVLEEDALTTHKEFLRIQHACYIMHNVLMHILERAYLRVLCAHHAQRVPAHTTCMLHHAVMHICECAYLCVYALALILDNLWRTHSPATTSSCVHTRHFLHTMHLLHTGYIMMSKMYMYVNMCMCPWGRLDLFFVNSFCICAHMLEYIHTSCLWYTSA